MRGHNKQKRRDCVLVKNGWDGELSKAKPAGLCDAPGGVEEERGGGGPGWRLPGCLDSKTRRIRAQRVVMKDWEMLRFHGSQDYRGGRMHWSRQYAG